MDTQLTASGEALRLFFTDDVYLVNEADIQLNIAEPVLAELANEPIALSVPEPVAFKFLGKNQRNILILVNDEQNDVSDERGRELLRKIVKSVNLTANDFALLNYAAYSSAGFKQLLDYFSCSLIFAFGVTPAQLLLSVHPENVIVSEGPVRLIFSAELRQLDQNPSAKKALWGSLQNLGL